MPAVQEAGREDRARVSTPKVKRPLSIGDAKKAGFTVLERRDRDTYEKL